MKKNTLLIMLLFSVTGLFAQNDFLKNLENNNPKFTESVLIFHKPNCPYCEQMEKLISKDSNLQQKTKEKYNVFIIDISSVEGNKVAQLYNVKAVPTIIKYNNELQSYSTLNGFGSIAKFLNFLGIKMNHKIDATLNKNVTSVCGNGNIEPGEQCDDANTINGDGCNDVCMYENPDCGNNTINAGEQCDDGNLINGDGCNMYCLLENLTCGNGTLNAGEQCDDGNNLNGDGCNFSCLLEGIICGNGIVNAGEQCDDANTVNGDGCNSTCFVEPGYSCVGSPSVCNVLGLEDNANLFVSLKTYPNPFSEIINLSVNLNASVDVEMLLLDFRGKLIKTSSKQNLTSGENVVAMEIDNTLQTGMYFVKIQITNSNGVFYETRKLIKNK